MGEISRRAGFPCIIFLCIILECHSKTIKNVFSKTENINVDFARKIAKIKDVVAEEILKITALPNARIVAARALISAKNERPNGVPLDSA